METRAYHTMDKTTWGSGPWQSEPDKLQWQDEATGLPCLVVRNWRGNLCGYVGVPSSHPAHGKPYSTWNYDYDGNKLPTTAVVEAINNIEVHGGLTFASGCGHGDDESTGVCHVPAAGEPDDAHWFGFDCAHSWDLSPGHAASYPQFCCDDTEYRTLPYVQDECRELARQLAALAVLDDVATAVTASGVLGTLNLQTFSAEHDAERYRWLKANASQVLGLSPNSALFLDEFIDKQIEELRRAN